MSLLEWLSLRGVRDRMDRRQAFRELRTFEQESLWAASDSSNPLNQAKISVQVGDYAEAARQWEDAITRYRALARKSRDSIKVLLALKRFDEAEALMVSCRKEFPGDPHYAEGYALVAQRRGDTTEAISRWRRVRKRFPGTWMSYVEETACLSMIGEHTEAEKLITRAIRQFPEVLHVWIQWGRVADASEQWQQSAERWRIVSSKFPWVGAPIGRSRALQRLGKPVEALEVLTAVEDEFPRDPDFRSELAKVRQLQN